MSEQRSDPDRELRDVIARDREKRKAQDAREAERLREERERERIPQAIDALRRSGPLEDRTADEVWLDLLARLLDALAAAGKAGLLEKLPARGNARRFTRRCAELLTAGRRREALALLEPIGPGELDAELANERNVDLPDDLCRLLALPVPQPPSPVETVLPATPRPDSEPAEDGALTGRDHPPLTPEDAAILKVLLQAGGVTMTVERIEGKVSLSDKTIRKRLQSLRDRDMVEEPMPKKGHCLTAAGQSLAGGLPADAGAEFLNPARTGR
jgi:hypothetical protein